MFKYLVPISLLATAAAYFDGPSSSTAKAKSPGIDRVLSITVLVKDQEEALRWYTEKLGFEKRADDTQTMPNFRWLTVGPRSQPELDIVLLLAKEDTLALVGKGTTTVVTTTDCKKAFEELQARGVSFAGGVQDMPWGVTANFVDLYGNSYHLLQAKKR